MVRDDFGWIVESSEAYVSVVAGGEEVARGEISFDALMARSYDLRLPVRSGLTADPEGSRSNTINADENFSFTVLIDGEVYLPIEVTSGQLFSADPGEIVTVDLTLGQDDDRDGLPDAWEFFQLQAAGIGTGDELYNLDTLTLEGDFDNDGLSNLDEFFGGTLALDDVDVFALQDPEIHLESGMISFEVFVVGGKRYQLLTGSNLEEEFAPTSIRLENRLSAQSQAVWTSNSTGFRRIYTPLQSGGGAAFFRLRAL